MFLKAWSFGGVWDLYSKKEAQECDNVRAGRDKEQGTLTSGLTAGHPGL